MLPQSSKLAITLFGKKENCHTEQLACQIPIKLESRSFSLGLVESKNTMLWPLGNYHEENMETGYRSPGLNVKLTF